MANFNDDIHLIQKAIMLATEKNDYSGLDAKNMRGALHRVCKYMAKQEELEAQMWNLPVVEVEGEDYYTTTNPVEVEQQLKRIVGTKLTLPKMKWLQDCFTNNIFHELGNKDKT